MIYFLSESKGLHLSSNVTSLIAGLDLQAPASDKSIAEAERVLGIKFPEDYYSFLKITNGGEGFIGDHEYIMLWSVDDLEATNKAYEIELNLPKLIIFGSDGAGNAYGFDTRAPKVKIVRVPFIGMEWNIAEDLGKNFTEFLQNVQNLNA